LIATSLQPSPKKQINVEHGKQGMAINSVCRTILLQIILSSKNNPISHFCEQEKNYTIMWNKPWTIREGLAIGGGLIIIGQFCNASRAALTGNFLPFPPTSSPSVSTY